MSRICAWAMAAAMMGLLGSAAAARAQEPGVFVSQDSASLGTASAKLVHGAENREDWVKTAAELAYREAGKGKYNVMVVKASADHVWLEEPTGGPGGSVLRRTAVYNDQFEGTISFEIYVFDHGKFKLNGDGGYINWCFYGGDRQNDNGQHDDNGRVVAFSSLAASSDAKPGFDMPRGPVIEDPLIEDPVFENPVMEYPVIEDPVIENPNDGKVYPHVLFVSEVPLVG